MSSARFPFSPDGDGTPAPTPDASERPTRPNLRLVTGEVRLTWAEAVEEFLADRKLRQESDATLVWWRSVLDPFGRHLSAGDAPSVVTEEGVRGFLRRMGSEGTKGRPCGASRLNQYRDGLRLFFEWLCGQGYADHNPAAGIPKIKEPRRVIQTLAAEQVQALVEQPDTGTVLGRRDRCFLLILLDTGLRLSEALGLRVNDVDLEGGVARIMGKGRRERRVGLSLGLVSELRAYLRHRQQALEEIDEAESPWLFPNVEGGRLCSKTMQQAVRRYGVEAGIDPSRVRLSPHTLRHTYAVTFVRNGGDPFTLQKVLGHSSLDTSRRYCELADEDVVRRARDLSPVASLGLASVGGRRFRRKTGLRRPLSGADPEGRAPGSSAPGG